MMMKGEDIRSRERARIALMLRESADEEVSRARAAHGIKHPVYDQAQRTAAAWRQAAIAVEAME